MRFSRKSLVKPLRTMLQQNGSGSSIPLMEPPTTRMAIPVSAFRLDWNEREGLSWVLFTIRRDGSAALDLAYVAAGRFDGFWEDGLSPWDMAAGVLLVEEASGRVSDFRGNRLDIYTPQVLVSNGAIHEAMMSVLRR